jgi:hypothetical protein
MNTDMKTHILLKSFPEYVKPSYEIMTHKKVSDEYNLEVAIPYGKKSFIWFTMYESNPLCCIIECGRNKKLQDNIHIVPFPWVNNLFLGTILSGYLIEYEENPEIKYFLADDVYSLNGYEFCNPFPVPLTQKLGAFTDFFSRLPGRIFGNYNIHSIVMNGRHVNTSWKETVAYPVKFIQYRSSDAIIPYLNWTSSKNCFGKEDDEVVKKDKVWTDTIVNVPDWNLNLQNPLYHSKQLFWISADLRYDLYYLYVQKGVLYEHAFIPDMVTSMMMNAIFRKIPENQCLDRVEESEDEEEFENIKENRYLKTEQKVLMECIFNRKFKRWVPLGKKPENLAKYVPQIDYLIHSIHHKKKNIGNKRKMYNI